MKGVRKLDVINERFRELREAYNKTQTEWAKILGLSRSGVSEIESGRRKVTNKHIKLLEAWEGNEGKQVNADWLIKGEGEMFRQPSDEIGYYVEDLLEYEGHGNAFYDLIIEMIKKYQELDEKSKTVMRDYFDSVVKAIKKEGS